MKNYLVPYRLHVLPVWPFRGWLAFTLGKHIFAARLLTTTELEHELVHVQQWRDYGLSFIPRYLLASLRSWRAGTGWYWGNAYEVEAREPWG